MKTFDVIKDAEGRKHGPVSRASSPPLCGLDVTEPLVVVPPGAPLPQLATKNATEAKRNRNSSGCFIGVSFLFAHRLDSRSPTAENMQPAAAARDAAAGEPGAPRRRESSGGACLGYLAE